MSLSRESNGTLSTQEDFPGTAQSVATLQQLADCSLKQTHLSFIMASIWLPYKWNIGIILLHVIPEKFGHVSAYSKGEIFFSPGTKDWIYDLICTCSMTDRSFLAVAGALNGKHFRALAWVRAPWGFSIPLTQWPHSIRSCCIRGRRLSLSSSSCLRPLSQRVLQGISVP